MADEKVSGLTLGTTIAFIAPGFVALNAIALHVPIAASWLSSAAEKEQGVGLFLFVALASLSLGVVVSGIRALFLERLCAVSITRLSPGFVRPKADYAKLREDKALAAFEAINENYYRYHQFYGNMLVSVALVMIAHGASRASSWGCPTWLVLVVVLLVLFVSARDSLRRYSDAVTKLMS